MKKHSDLNLEEKVDLLLEHQEKAIFWARVKAILYILFFVIFIVLPIVWSVILIRELFEGINFDAMLGTIESLQAPMSIDILKGLIN